MADDTGFTYDFTRKLAGALLTVVRKTLELLTDNRVATTILNLAGVKVEALPGAPNPNLAALEAIQTFADGEGAADLAELVTLLDEIDKAVQPIRVWLAAIMVGSDSQKVEETLWLLGKIVASLIVKRTFPGTFRLLQLSGLLKDGLPDYEATFFTGQVLKELFAGELKVLKELFFEDLGDKLETLRDRQVEAVEQCQLLLPDTSGSQSWIGEVENLKSDQTELQQDTARLRTEMQQVTSKKSDAAIRHVGDAIDFQVSSLDPLNTRILANALPLQIQALEELEKGLEALATLENTERGAFFNTLLAGAYLAMEAYDKVPTANVGILSGWESTDQTTTPIADDIANRALTLTFGNEDFDGFNGARAHLGLVWVSGEHNDKVGPGLMFSLGGSFRAARPLGPLLLEYALEAAAPATFFVGKGSAAAGNSDARFTTTLARDPELAPERATFNFGASYLSIGHMRFRHTIAAERIDASIEFSDTDLFLKEADNGGFVNAILPKDGLNARFTLGLKADLLRGRLSFSEGTSMRAVMPIGGDGFGGVRIPYVTLDLSDDPEQDALETVNEISATVEIKWDSLNINLERMGYRFFIPGRAGRTGLSRHIQFKPPSGAGFQLDAKAVKGGGYLFHDEGEGEWGGVVHLDIKTSVSLTALGLVKEGLPGAPDDFALVVMGSAQFRPGLGPLFGMTLQGLGLLYAHNRTIDTDHLRQGVKTGLIDAVLFPLDPVANAPQILNDMRRLFPIARHRRAIGMLLLINFGSGNSARLKLGVAIDWPHPNTLALLGSLKIRLPNFDSEEPSAQIFADFALIWDEAAKFVSFDAALRDSHVLNTLTLTGDMAARWHYGDPGTFVLAMGGYHPAFNASGELPANAQMPRLERLALALGTGSNPRVRALAYFAITPNTVQGGLRAEVVARKAGFTLEGWIGGDALFERETNRLIIEFSAGVSIRKGRRVLFTLTLEGRFEGFRPICISGKVKFKILFISVTIPVTLNIGEARPDRLVDFDLGPKLVEQLRLDSAWGESRPLTSEQVASFGLGTSARRLAFRPSAQPSVRQGLAPLNLRLDRYESARLSGDTRFEITEFLINGQDPGTQPITDKFAPGQYFNLSDDQRLSRPSFETYGAGVQSADQGFEFGPGVEADLGYENILIDQRTDRRRRLGDFMIDRATLAAALPFAVAASARLRLEDRFPVRLNPVAVNTGGFVVATTSDLGLANALTAQPQTYQAARDMLDSHLRDHPEHAARLQIVEAHQGVVDV
jgi:hypothetical protein